MGLSPEQRADYPDTLFDHHAELLIERGVSAETARQRGYTTFDTAKGLADSTGWSYPTALKWVRSKENQYVLGIPLWWGTKNLEHQPVPTRNRGKARGNLWQIRPDEPGDGPKYLTQASTRKGGKGDGVHLDSPPETWQHVLNGDTPLLITEGPIKGDSVASAATKENIPLGVISVCGVTMWRNTGDEWNSLPLRGRTIYLCFDSDAVTNPKVYRELVNLHEFLTTKHHGNVQIVLLPQTDDNKTGIDDHLASGNLLADTLKLAVENLPEPPVNTETVLASSGVYIDEENVCVIKRTVDRNTGAVKNELLTDWLARIVTIINPCDAESDINSGPDADHKIRYKIEISALFGTKTRTTTVIIDADKFDRLDWLRSEIAMLAGRTIPTTTSLRADTTNALRTWRTDEQNIESEWKHTGWVPSEEIGWAYVAGTGAIGARGTTDEINTQLQSPLPKYEIPEIGPGTDPFLIRDGIELLMSAYDLFNFPEFFYILVGAGLSPVTPTRHPRVSVMLLGLPKSGKTWSAANVTLSMFGDWSDGEMPGDFASTANYSQALAASASHLPVVFDDLSRTESRQTTEANLTAMQTLIRSTWNHSGRGRLRPDGTMKESKPPRCLTVITAEHFPGETTSTSLSERMLILEYVGPNRQGQTPTLPSEAVHDWEFENAHDRLPYMTSDFIWWWAKLLSPEHTTLQHPDNETWTQPALTKHIEKMVKNVHAKIRLAAKKALPRADARASSAVTEIVIGWYFFNEYLKEIHPDLAEKYRDRINIDNVIRSVSSLSARNNERRNETNIPARFISALSSYMSSGAGYIADIYGAAPKRREQPFGWKKQTGSLDDGWTANGKRIGVWYQDALGKDEHLIGFYRDEMFRGVKSLETSLKSIVDASILEELDTARLIIKEGPGYANGKYGRKMEIDEAGSQQTLVLFKASTILGEDTPTPDDLTSEGLFA